MPYANTEALNAHLKEIGRIVEPGAHAVVMLDQAGWHTSLDLEVPDNITLMPLPPRSPELNPVENVWQFMRDEVKTTTCYMCACRCGIKVHLKNGKIRYIEGNPDHPVNKGILCGKGSAGNTIRATAS